MKLILWTFLQTRDSWVVPLSPKSWEECALSCIAVVLLVPRETFALVYFCASFLTFLPGVRYSVLFHKNFWCIRKLSPHVDHPVLLTVIFFLLYLTERVQRIWSVFARDWLDIVSQIAPLLLQPDVPLCLWSLWEQSCKMPYFPSVPMYVQVLSSREVASANQNLCNSAEWTTHWPTGVKCRATIVAKDAHDSETLC